MGSANHGMNEAYVQLFIESKSAAETGFFPRDSKAFPGGFEQLNQLGAIHAVVRVLQLGAAA